MINKEQVSTLCEEALANTDRFLVEVKVKPNNVIEVYVDSDTAVNIDHCAELSRYINERLDRDVEDYALTVTSAGLDLPFKDIRQYRKAIGSQVEVLVRDGRKLIATLLACDETGVSLAWSAKEAVDGQKKKVLVEHEETFPYAVLNAVRPHIDFK